MKKLDMAQSKSIEPKDKIMIPFCKSTISEEEIEAVSRVMRSGWMACGPETAAFEKEFADYLACPDPETDGMTMKVPYCIFTASCTAALKIAYKWAKEVKKINTLSYPSNTFCATYAAGAEMGLQMIPNGEVGFNQPEGRVNVHYGSIKDTTPCLIEDSAHRIETRDEFVGKIKCYSFYVTKNMTVGGQGGMFVTHDKDIYDFARLCWKDGLTTSTADRLGGNIVDYEVKLMAGGYDADDVRAAVGRVQLKKLPAMNAERNRIAGIYNEAFNQSWKGNHLYPFFVKSVEDVYRLRQHLKDQGIASGYHYPGTGWLGVSLPIYPGMTDAEIEEVITNVRAFR